jgi:hypothetical protein
MVAKGVFNAPKPSSRAVKPPQLLFLFLACIFFVFFLSPPPYIFCWVYITFKNIIEISHSLINVACIIGHLICY